MPQPQTVTAPTIEPPADEDGGRILVRCAICEQDRALVASHGAADRLLASHLTDCPGRGAGPDA